MLYMYNARSLDSRLSIEGPTMSAVGTSVATILWSICFIPKFLLTFSVIRSATHVASNPFFGSFIVLFSVNELAVATELILVVFDSTSR